MAKVKWHVKKVATGLMMLSACQLLAQEHGFTLKDPTQP